MDVFSCFFCIHNNQHIYNAAIAIIGSIISSLSCKFYSFTYMYMKHISV